MSYISFCVANGRNTPMTNKCKPEGNKLWALASIFATDSRPKP